MNTKEKKWFLLQAQFNYERLVADRLNKEGKLKNIFVRCIVPMERTFVMRKGVKELKETVYMRGYVYVETYSENIAEIAAISRTIQGCQGFLKDKKSIYPRPLPKRDVDQLAKLVGSEEIYGQVDNNEQVYSGTNTMVVSSIYKENDAVKIISGVYEGMVAEVKNVDNNLIKVAVKIFGREVPMELDKSEITHI